MSFENILTESRERVGLITFNRPGALNALSSPLLAELAVALDAFEADDGIGAIVITGNEKAFAAGADIKEMQDRSYMEMYLGDHFGDSARVARCRKPVVAAVAGYALGGGCELAMMCDIIIAADNAQFGQPEVTLGVLPGLGATTGAACPPPHPTAAAPRASSTETLAATHRHAHPPSRGTPW